MNFVTVYCEVETCIYCQEKRCTTTGIEINSDQICETYEQEVLRDPENPDKERD